MLLDPPPPVTNCHTFSDPLERDVLYGRPLSRKSWLKWRGDKNIMKLPPVDEKFDLVLSGCFLLAHLGFFIFYSVVSLLLHTVMLRIGIRIGIPILSCHTSFA